MTIEPVDRRILDSGPCLSDSHSNVTRVPDTGYSEPVTPKIQQTALQSSRSITGGGMSKCSMCNWFYI